MSSLLNKKVIENIFPRIQPATNVLKVIQFVLNAIRL